MQKTDKRRRVIVQPRDNRLRRQTDVNSFCCRYLGASTWMQFVAYLFTSPRRVSYYIRTKNKIFPAHAARIFTEVMRYFNIHWQHTVRVVTAIVMTSRDFYCFVFINSFTSVISLLLLLFGSADEVQNDRKHRRRFGNFLHFDRNLTSQNIDKVDRALRSAPYLWAVWSTADRTVW